jgi:hypothetical protein
MILGPERACQKGRIIVQEADSATTRWGEAYIVVFFVFELATSCYDRRRGRRCAPFFIIYME